MADMEQEVATVLMKDLERVLIVNDRSLPSLSSGFNPDQQLYVNIGTPAS